MDHHPAADQPAAPSIDSLSGVLLIMFAKALGYAMLAICAVVILRGTPWRFGIADLLFWAAAVAIPLARQRVARKYEAPGAERPLLRRIVLHLVAAAVVWVPAQALQL